MQDLIYLAIVVGFFLVAYLLVIGCDRIIGSDELHLVESTDGDDNTQGRAA